MITISRLKQTHVMLYRWVQVDVVRVAQRCFENRKNVYRHCMSTTVKTRHYPAQKATSTSLWWAGDNRVFILAQVCCKLSLLYPLYFTLLSCQFAQMSFAVTIIIFSIFKTTKQIIKEPTDHSGPLTLCLSWLNDNN
jgi:hypothetical protein